MLDSWLLTTSEGIALLTAGIIALTWYLGWLTQMFQWLWDRNKTTTIKVEADTIPKGASGKVTLTLEAYEARIQQARAEVLAQIPDASGEQLQLLSAKRDEYEKRLADIEPAFEQARARIAELEDLLKRESNELDADDLTEAEAALESGDFDAAEALLIRIEGKGDLEIQRTARAAYGRGQIAEEQVRWLDAADHYAKAARLDPTDELLGKAREFLWRAGRYDDALRICRDRLEKRKRKHGDKSPETAEALSDLALMHNELGQNNQAVPLYRQAIEIDKATIGEAHPDYAIRLNNLAIVLQDMGQNDEAEPLYRQAIEIAKATTGEARPDYAIRLNTLANVLQDMGQNDKAAPLYRQAIEITKATIGETHPNYAIRLNNLAGLLRAMGRYDDAEPLYRQAMVITKTALGETHPGYATRLNNFANLPRDMGRSDDARPYAEDATSIFRASLGDDHPHTQKVAANYARLLREHFPDDPALAELEATFGSDIGN
ncbi:MAG: tetratricopeptide repeat protein [Pseudomonadota bacterium]